MKIIKKNGEKMKSAKILRKYFNYIKYDENDGRFRDTNIAALKFH